MPVLGAGASAGGLDAFKLLLGTVRFLREGNAARLVSAERTMGVGGPVSCRMGR